jgi:DNA (cytosine-5)-methyltransferase 1
MGYRLAGFEFLAQIERDETRAEIGRRNFSGSLWVACTVEKATSEVVGTVQARAARLDALIATPPCQGLSSSNPSRGKRRTEKAWRNAAKNRLLLEVLPLVKELRPRVVIAENVRQILTHRARRNGQVLTLPDLLREELPDYAVFSGVVNVADYGIPQIRRRAVIVAVERGEPWLSELRRRNLLPWPKPTHTERPVNGRRPWLTVRQWMRAMKYESLEASSVAKATGSHPLHFVPIYDESRFRLVRDIPRYTGESAYENSTCPTCGRAGVPAGLATCPKCRKPLFNRPIVVANGRARLVKGFKSSYRRMHADRPAATITTNSSHVGSDNKIHPWEHRVLSILECADLQTVPRFYDWSHALETNRTYLIRNLIGEAFPPYFTYLHGKVLRGLLRGSDRVFAELVEIS